MTILALALMAAPAVARAPAPRLGGWRGFPAGHAWNRDVSKAPVDPRSADYVRSIGLDRNVHPDFGSGRYGDYGIPLTVVARDQPLAPIRFTPHGDESDPGAYPGPPRA